MGKHSYGLFFALGASFLLSMVFIPPYNIISGDKEIYRYIAQVIQNGGVPYRDVFDHKPPLIYFLNYLSLQLGGNWAQWTIDTLLALLATYLFFQLCRKYRLPFPWLLPLLFNLMLRDFLICLGMGMTREYTTILLVIFFCVLLGGYRYRYLIMGFLCGLIFFMQQDQVFGLIPLFICALLPGEDPAPFFTRVLRMAAGFLVVALPIVVYFAWHGSLSYFWQDAFLFNMTWYTTTLKESFGDHLRKLKTVLDQGNYEVPFMIALVLGICAAFYKSNNRKWILASLAMMALSLSPGFMGGRDIVPAIRYMTFTHYQLPLAASIPFVLFCVFAFTEELVLRDRKAQWIYGTLACCSLLYTDLQHGTHNSPIAETEVMNSAELKYLRAHRPGNYQLYEMGSNDYVRLYSELGVIGPSKWVYLHFAALYTNWDPDLAKLRSVGDDLQRHRTTYVLDFTRKSPSFFLDPHAYEWWQSFLIEHYDSIPLPGYHESTLWKWKGSPE